MAAIGQRLRQLGRDDAAAADRGVADDADVHGFTGSGLRSAVKRFTGSGFKVSFLNRFGRTIGSLTTTPSANATPASAPNWASRLSISCSKSGDVRRVCHAVGRADLELAHVAAPARGASLVVRRDVDDERRRRRVVDEVVADPLRPPRSASARVVAPQPAVEDGLGQHLARGDVIRMAIGPVRDRDRARTRGADERGGGADVLGVPADGAVGPAQVDAPCARRAPRAPLRLRRAVRRRCRCCPSRPRSDRTGRRDDPSATCFAMVPPRPISRSSGCGPKTSRSTGSIALLSRLDRARRGPGR